MVLGGIEWDKKEFLESKLHMYGRDDTKMVVYSMGRWPKKGDRKNSRNPCNNIVNSWNFVHQQDIIT